MNHIRSFFLCGTILCIILPLYFASTNNTKISVTVWRRGKALKIQSPLCPKEGPGYAFNNKTNSCEKLGVQGSCDSLMRFTYNTNSSNPGYGYCECDFYKKCGRPVVKWSNGKCYFVNEQGPCMKNEWITLREDKTPVCTPNPCLIEESQTPSNGSTFWFSTEDEKCYQTNTRGYCEEQGSRLFFGRQDIKPTCKFGVVCGAINGTKLNGIIKSWNLSLQSNQSSTSKGGESIYASFNL